MSQDEKMRNIFLANARQEAELGGVHQDDGSGKTLNRIERP